MTAPRKSTRYRPHLIALEPRMMFDAAAAAVVADAVAGDPGHAPVDGDHSTVGAIHDVSDPARAYAGDPAMHDVAGAEPAPAPAREIIFIDAAVADYRQLAAEWADRGDIVLIDATRDGIDQMRQALAGRGDVTAIHIVSHGSSGVLALGTTRIDQAAITGDLAASLGAIGRTLTNDGDILIYGCDFAGGSAGASALAAFARATDADVAASIDTTGYAMRGGDWTLEAREGAVDARALDAGDWVHTLDPNVPVPIAVTADSLTVRNGAGTIVTSGTTGYGADSRSADVGLGATATWAGAATFNGRTVDLRATVVSISTGDVVRFNRPTGTGNNGDDPTFLLRDLSATNDASVQIRWELIDQATGNPLPADVRFTIADIDGIDGNPNTRESVIASTQNLAYYTRERVSDINFAATLNSITASGTQNENLDNTQPVTPKSAATFDWSAVSAFTLTYRLTTNSVATQAQFFHDGDADFVYTDPVYVSVPRLDLDANDSTAAGADALHVFTENGPRVAIVDADLVVSNPMPSEGITGATVRLTNWRSGDNFAVGALPAGVTATVGAVVGGTQTITFSGTGSEADYADAFRAITFANSSENPDATQRVIEVTFSNDTLTSATAISRITIVPVNDAPTANPDTASTAEDRPVTIAVLANDTDPEGNALTVTAATALHGTVVRNANGTLTYTPNANYNGTDTISYTISDGNGGTSSSTVAVRIAPQPDSPVNTVPGAQAVAEDGVLIFSSANGNALSIADIDGGEQTVTISVTKGTFTLGSLAGLTFTAGDGTNDAAMAFTGTVAQINAALNGARYTPSPDANGPAQLSLTTASVSVEGEDFQNGDAEAPFVANNTFTFFTSDQVPGWRTTATDDQIEVWGNGYMGVTAYNGRQFFEVNATQVASLYQEVRSIAGSAVTLDFAHRGRSGTDTLRLTATDLGADGVFGTADDVVLAQGDYADGAAAWGTHSRQLTASATGNVIRIDFRAVSTAGGDQSVGNFLDGVAITQAGPPMSDTDTVAINITPVADIADDGVTTAEDTPVTYDPLANDSFEGLGRAITAVNGTPITAGGAAVAVANGQVALGTDGRFTFTPAANYAGTTSFTYTVTSNGASETATDTITVTPVNDAPMTVGTLPPRAAVDSATVSIATAGGFSDPDGDTLVYSATGLPPGLTIDATTGVISGVLGRSASQPGGGVYSIVVIVRDPSNLSQTQGFTLTVTNPAPVAVNDATTTVIEGGSVTVTVLANDSDPDGDPLTVTAASALHGTVVRNPDGTLTYTPSAGYAGPDTISYTISDGEGGSASATAAITVTPINDPPIANDDPTTTVVEDTPTTVVVLANDSDPDGDTLTVTAASALHGAVVRNANGTLTYTPNANYNGPDTISYTISDGNGGTASATAAILVTPVNDPPVAINDANVDVIEDTTATIVVLANDSDPEGDALTVTAASALHGTVVRNPDGTLGYTPHANYTGPDTISYTISDGHGGTASATAAITITPLNDSPTTAAALPPRRGADATAISFGTAAGFADPDGDTLNYSATGLPAGLTIDPATGVISGTLDRAASQVNGGRYAVTVTVRDPSGATATQSFVFTATNPAPVAADDSVTLLEDTSATIAVLANDSDPDGDPLTVIAASASHGTVVHNPDGTLRYTPDANFNGVDTISYTISDGNGGTASATVAVTVTPVNDPPVAVDDPTTTVVEDTPVTIAVLANDSDPDGDPLTVTAASALHGAVVRNANGTLTYTPDANYNGPDTISYTISDGHGGTASATAAIVVSAANDAPVRVGTVPAQSGADAGTVSFGTAAGFADGDGDALTYSAAGLPAGLTIDPVTGVISGTLDHAASQVNGGVYTITVTARDPSGATVTQSFTFTATNPPPVAVNDIATVVEDTPTTITVLANDSDPDGDPLIVMAASALHGTVVRNADGTLTYTPDANYTGPDTISYTIADGNGGTASATVAITVAPVNDAPVATGSLPPRGGDDAAPVSFGTAGGFGDLDGDTLTFSAAGLPAGLTIDPATGVISGTLDRAASQMGGGRYTVTVTARDPSGATATQTFVFTATNPPPVARNDVATTAEDTPTTIAVLANDSDPNGDRLIVIAAVADHGRVTINADGTLTYTPNADYNGPDTIRYTVDDGRGATANATVAVTVTPVNDAPAAIRPLPNRTATDGAPITFPTAAAFRDVEGDALTFSATGLPAGLGIDPATGIVSGTPDRSASQANGGRYTVTIAARDPSGAAAAASFVVTVANPAPTAADDRATTRPGAPIDIAILANDADPDGDPLSVIGATAANGTVAINSDGSLRYTANIGFTGTDTIRYMIGDGQGGTATAFVRIDVLDMPPAGGAIPDIAALDGQVIRLGLGTNFVDPDGDPLTFTATGLPPGLTIDPATGTITGTIDRAASAANGGVYTGVIIASDGFGGTIRQTLRWTVANPAPTAVGDRATTAEDTPVTIAVLANDTDPDGDALTPIAASAGHGTVTINPDGTLRYTPAADFNGIDTITYTIADAQGARSSATVTVTVAAVDDAPRTTGLSRYDAVDGTPIMLPTAPAFTDPEDGGLSYGATGLPPGLAIDRATGAITGTITPGSANGGPAHDGIFTVVVSATDPAGQTVSARFVLAVAQDAPTAHDDSVTTREDTPVTVQVLANDSDGDGDPLTIVAATATHGRVVIDGDSLVFTPDRDFNGTATITYAVSDPVGHRSSATVTVVVGAVDDAPTARPIASQSSRDGQPVALALGAFFADVDGDVLSYSATGLPAGLAIDPATGRITGTIDHAASQLNGGIYRVAITATANGRAASSAFDWIVTNPVPVAVNDTARTNEDTSLVVAPFSNDSDPDGDPIRIVGATAAHGSVAIGADGRLTYTPAANFNGEDAILYTIDDGNGGRASAVVQVTVDPVNDAPVTATGDPVPAYAGRPVVIDALAGVSDVDGDRVTVTGATAANGTVTVLPNGTLRFVPTIGFTGSTTITYTISDGRGGTATGTIVVAVSTEPAADVNQLLAIGTVHFPNPTPALATIFTTDGVIRNPITLLDTVEGIRTLNTTRIGDRAVIDAVNAIRTLDGTFIDAAAPVGGEIRRLDALTDRRDAGDRLFDHRWSDFEVRGLTGFSAAADRNACIMVEAVVRGGAIYLEVRDIAEDGRAAIRSVDVRDTHGRRLDWIKVDPRGLAIIERAADMDELHLVVRVTRENGRTTTTPIVVQGATGEVELDRPTARHHAAQPLDHTLTTPADQQRDAAARLASSFE